MSNRRTVSKKKILEQKRIERRTEKLLEENDNLSHQSVNMLVIEEEKAQAQVKKMTDELLEMVKNSLGI